ncbi:MAG: DUF6370 family protein [Daejeonella sp.]|uniref:DUF6370 family protein n=1 Tax=Daejeonella sp. TaxID=2805397 RepID=UPI0027348293|nr:DUF6370 family protein [Daejeonella sp.]MDP3467125.1 DUF6370 family protein [Daejeonella sp.]
MKIKLLLLLACFVFGSVNAQKNISRNNTTKEKVVQIAEASCGQCQFKMAGKGCDLAVRINGKSYFVDGTKIDDHGDAHAKDGFCEKIRKAGIKGSIVNNRFVATYFKLLPET